MNMGTNFGNEKEKNTSYKNVWIIVIAVFLLFMISRCASNTDSSSYGNQTTPEDL